MKKTVYLLFAFSFLFNHVLAQVNTQNTDKQRVLAITLNQKDSTVTIVNLSLSYGYISPHEKSGEYTLQTINKNGEIQSKINFNFPKIEQAPDPRIFDHKTGEQLLIPEINNSSFMTLFVPYTLTTESINITNKIGQVLTKVALKEYINPEVLERMETTNKIEEMYTRKNAYKTQTKIIEDKIKENTIMNVLNHKLYFLSGGIIIFAILIIGLKRNKYL